MASSCVWYRVCFRQKPPPPTSNATEYSPLLNHPHGGRVLGRHWSLIITSFLLLIRRRFRSRCQSTHRRWGSPWRWSIPESRLLVSPSRTYKIRVVRDPSNKCRNFLRNPVTYSLESVPRHRFLLSYHHSDQDIIRDFEEVPSKHAAEGDNHEYQT